MQIFKNCKQFIATVPFLSYSLTKTEDIDTDGEDHCLIGKTMVHTDAGKIPIRQLAGTQGRVLSSDGKYHRYTQCRKTQENVDVFTMELEDGSSVTATANHRFMLKDGTWKRLDELEIGDELKEVSHAG